MPRSGPHSTPGEDQPQDLSISPRSETPPEGSPPKQALSTGSAASLKSPWGWGMGPPISPTHTPLWPACLCSLKLRVLEEGRFVPRPRLLSIGDSVSPYSGPQSSHPQKQSPQMVPHCGKTFWSQTSKVGESRLASGARPRQTDSASQGLCPDWTRSCCKAQQQSGGCVCSQSSPLSPLVSSAAPSGPPGLGREWGGLRLRAEYLLSQ